MGFVFGYEGFGVVGGIIEGDIFAEGDERWSFGQFRLWVSRSVLNYDNSRHL